MDRETPLTSAEAAARADAEPAPSDADYIASPGQFPEAERRLAFLWAPPAQPTAGRRASLSLDDVVRAATEIADASGLEAVSMRRVASALGMGAMSLYTYVPGKAELVDLITDRAYAELAPPPPDAAPRAALHALASAERELYLRHPWLLETNPERQIPSPHQLDVEESYYVALVGWGWRGRQVVELLRTLSTFVRGYARTSTAERAAFAASGESSDDFWYSMSQFWVRYFDAGRYPTMLSLWESGGFDAGNATFDEALNGLLDAITPRPAA